VSELTFKELKIEPNILKVLEEMKFNIPTEIQEKAIPVLLGSDKHFIGQAQTGTGKTAAFVIPLLQKLDFNASFVQAIVLAPTRELAMQVEEEIKKLGKYTGLKTACIYGGTGYEGQINTLRSKKPHVVVGTPGRMIDLLKKKILKLDQTSLCVLDEADEMLTMGFAEDVQTILDEVSKSTQLMMFSATMPHAIKSMIQRSFNNPFMVKIEKKSLSNDDIDQKYFIVREKHFKEALARLVDNAPDMYGIVFCRTKLETKEVGDDLKSRGHLVEVLNGDMGQLERDHAMNKFKTGKVKIMVCTDVAARGIDVNNLSHVINYGLPRDNESYVHRIGRTGRAGMKGSAFTITGPRTSSGIKSLEKHINKNIVLDKLPTIIDLKTKMVEKEIEGAEQILEAIKLKGNDFKTEVAYELFEQKFGDLSKEELMKLVFVWKFNKSMRRYNNLEDIEESEDAKPKRRNRKRSIDTGAKVARGSRDRRPSSEKRDFSRPARKNTGKKNFSRK